MSKEYYKKRIIDLRASIAREKEAKKKQKQNFQWENGKVVHMKMNL